MFHGILQNFLASLNVTTPKEERFKYFHKKLAEYYVDLKFDDEKMAIYLPNGYWFKYINDDDDNWSYFKVCYHDHYDYNIINEDVLDSCNFYGLSDNYVISFLIDKINGFLTLKWELAAPLDEDAALNCGSLSPPM